METQRPAFGLSIKLAESFALRKAGDGVAARSVLEEAVAARPGFLHALGYLGEDRMEHGDTALARVEFERASRAESVEGEELQCRAPGRPDGSEGVPLPIRRFAPRSG